MVEHLCDSGTSTPSSSTEGTSGERSSDNPSADLAEAYLPKPVVHDRRET